jgi:hypothetical protein
VSRTYWEEKQCANVITRLALFSKLVSFSERESQFIPNFRLPPVIHTFYSDGQNAIFLGKTNGA